MQRGARLRAALHGVPRRRRRAARDRGRGRAAAPAGLVQRLRRVAGDAGAGDRARARGERARPARARRRGRGRGAAAPARRRRTRSGSSSPGVAGLERGRLVAAGRGLVVANVAGTLLAYHDRCAGCGGRLADGELAGGKLACAHCGRRFDLPRAGRGVDDAELQLEPVPLLRNGGPVRVALPPERAAVRPRPRTASCARSASARTTATCCRSPSAASSACARRAGRCTRATPSSGRRARARWCSTGSA